MATWNSENDCQGSSVGNQVPCRPDSATAVPSTVLSMIHGRIDKQICGCNQLKLVLLHVWHPLLCTRCSAPRTQRKSCMDRVARPTVVEDVYHQCFERTTCQSRRWVSVFDLHDLHYAKLSGVEGLHISGKHGDMAGAPGYCAQSPLAPLN